MHPESQMRTSEGVRYKGKHVVVRNANARRDFHLFGQRALWVIWDGPGLFAERDYAESSVAVIVVASGEEKLIGIAVCAGRAALAELNGPDVVDLDSLPAGVAKRAEECAALRIKRVDTAVGSIVGDEQCAAHRPEIGWGYRNTPRRMQRAAERKVREQGACGGEGIHESALGFTEGGVSDADRLSAVGGGDGLNAVGSKLLWNLGINKRIRAELVVDQCERGIEYVDPAVRSVVSSVEQWLATVVGNGQAGIDCTDGRTVGRWCDSRGAGTRGGDSADRRIPSADRAIERRENENRVG